MHVKGLRAHVCLYKHVVHHKLSPLWKASRVHLGVSTEQHEPLRSALIYSSFQMAFSWRAEAAVNVRVSVPYAPGHTFTTRVKRCGKKNSVDVENRGGQKEEDIRALRKPALFSLYFSVLLFYSACTCRIIWNISPSHRTRSHPRQSCRKACISYCTETAALLEHLRFYLNPSLMFSVSMEPTSANKNSLFKLHWRKSDTKITPGEVVLH